MFFLKSSPPSSVGVMRCSFDPIVATAIADEHDALAIGREARLTIEPHPTREARGFSARDRQRVQIAHEVEDDRASVGRDVERHPRPFVGVECGLARGEERQLGVRGGFLGGVGWSILRRGHRGAADGEGEDDSERAARTHEALQIGGAMGW
jgi:hypothetical protein